MAKFNDVTVGQIEACINRMGGMPQFLDWIAGKGQIVWQTIATLYSVVVDYSQPLDEILSAGKYDLVDHNITEKNFPKTADGVVELNIELVHFNHGISSDSVVAEMDKMGLRPATIWELLAFGAKYPELQRQFPIVAIGSVCELSGGRGRHVGFLHGRGSGRLANVHRWGRVWYGSYIFLAVRK